MVTYQEVLKEIPLVSGRIPEQFTHLHRLLTTQRFSNEELEYLQEGIVAERERLGMLKGRNKRKLVDGKWCYVNIEKE